MKKFVRFLASAPASAPTSAAACSRLDSAAPRPGAPPRFRGRRGHNRRGGSTLIETALCLTFILLPLLLGGLQFGLVLTTTNALEQVSREAGRYAAMHYGEPTFDSNENQGNTAGSDRSLKNYVRIVAEDNDIPWNDIKDKITVSPASGSRSSGQPITVTIKYPMSKRSILGQPATLFFAPTAGGNLKLNFLSQDYTVASTFVMQ